MTNDHSFSCRGCGHKAQHETVISLGSLPLGNSLLKKEALSEPEHRFPLELAFCNRCTLLQVSEAIPPDLLLQQNLYFTSSSPALLRHGRDLANRLIDEMGLTEQSLVIEIGSNDGTLLKDFRQRNVQVLGIEPIEHSAKIAEHQHGIRTISDVFTSKLANQLKSQGQCADIILANYVLELIPDLPDFISGVRDLLKPTGIAVMEVPYVKSMIEQGRLDAIAHLRLTWFSVTAIENIFRRCGMTLTNVEYLPAFRGGTLRFFASPGSAAQASPVVSILQEESQSGLNDAKFYRSFGTKIAQSARDLREFLSHARQEGKSIAAYGAGIKASTLLNFSQLGTELIDFTVDGNPLKQGLYVPGAHLPIGDPKLLIEKAPHYTLLLALDHVDEIVQQQSTYRQRGGRFVIPFPTLSIV